MTADAPLPDPPPSPKGIVNIRDDPFAFLSTLPSDMRDGDVMHAMVTWMQQGNPKDKDERRLKAAETERKSDAGRAALSAEREEGDRHD